MAPVERPHSYRVGLPMASAQPKTSMPGTRACPRQGRAEHDRASCRDCALSPRAFAAPGAELDRAVRDDDAEGRADGAVDQADLAAMGADQLGCDRKAKPRAAAPC